MDKFPPAFPAWGAGLLGAWLVIGAAVYICLARLVARGGGKVSTLEFGQPDLLVCLAFMLWFVMDIVTSFGGPEHVVTQKEIIHGAILFVTIVAGLGIFMQYRGINPLRQFGIFRRNAFLCAALAVGLLLAAGPLVVLTENLTAFAQNGKVQPQNIVEFFISASESSNKKAVWVMMVLAVVVAPAAEETIFRGYIYGVLKRYAGTLVAGLTSASLFAAMHLNMSSLPALFVLALCFTLAYEATGSLLVNIFMHALFNLTMLLTMLELVHRHSHP